MNSASASKARIALFAALVYTAIMGIGMVYMKSFLGITYGRPEMMTVFWSILILLNVINVIWVTRFFGWQAIGFRALHRKQLLWLLPSLVVLFAMWAVCLSGLSQTTLSSGQWQLVAVAGFATLLVGMGEEIMYRGIVLHAFLSGNRVRWAMLVSALLFALLHAVNVFGGVPYVAVPMQLLLTFLWGVLFAPLMLRLNNIIPLIIIHWLWDFVVFVAPLVSEQTHASVGVIGLLHVPVELVVGITLWVQIKQVPQEAIVNTQKAVMSWSHSPQ